MKRAFLNLRLSKPDRVRLFESGLKRHGYQTVLGHTTTPRDGDLLMTWNRIHAGQVAADAFERAGCLVLCVENSSWGNSFAGDNWLTMAVSRHNTAGAFPVGGPERWDSLGVELAPWRAEGETVILGQRSIGSPPVSSPRQWAEAAWRKYGGRIRPHPGIRNATPLEDDLAHCGRVVTWGSGAAIKALLWGIPVVSEMPSWIGECEATDRSRLAMFRRLAWAQWRHSEIESGEAFAHLL
jgi:hypothetical protein